MKPYTLPMLLLLLGLPVLTSVVIRLAIGSGEAGYADHPSIALLPLVLGISFILIGPFQVIRREALAPVRAAVVALCLAPWSAMAAEVGDVLKPVTLRDVDDKTTATPRNKVIALFYTDPDAHELTDLLFERIKSRRFDKRFYDTVVVINMEDSKIPSFLISAGVTSESQKGKATFLFDDELTAAKAWRLGDCNSDSVFIIMGTDSTVKYIHRGEMREAEITAVLELIDSLIAEAKAAATSQ